jgi:hypothetical protein
MKSFKEAFLLLLYFLNIYLRFLNNSFFAIQVSNFLINRTNMKDLHFNLLKSQFIVLLFLFTLNSSAQNNSASLEGGFKNPPGESKPRTWWHWTNSNITKDGITKDLEWMNRIGIGGMQLADVASGSGQTVEKKILFGSSEWLDAVKHSASESQRLNLEMTIFSSAGWSLTGGPWVKPEQAMKKLVWSETNINGPKKFSGAIGKPPSCEGPIGNMSRSAQNSEPSYYKDCLVLAFRTEAGEGEFSNTHFEVSTATGSFDPKLITDNDLNTSVRIRASKETKSAWMLFTFDQPYRAQAITIASRSGIPFGRLSVSDDGKEFRIVALLPGPQLYRAGKVETVAFPESVAKYYRFDFTGAPWKPAEVMAETDPKPDSVYILNEVTIHSGSKVNRWEDKAGFFHLFNYDPVTVSSTHSTLSTSFIDPSKIIDLTSKMDQNGILTWDIPEGKWTIMRFGYSLTGSKNRPAVPSGLGYEVDKLSREHTLSYLHGYTDPIAGALGSLYGKGLGYVLLDSWEAGMQNWTDKMIPEFMKRRGYDPTPFLPAMSGHIVGDPNISDRFLWDFRRTLADMFAENHFSVATEFFNNQGIGTYGEVSGVSLEILEDALLSKKYVNIPMGEFWFRPLHPALMYYQDIRGAASASHVYGKKVVAAESFTGGGFESPWSLKKIGDYWFAQGVNRIIFHTSAHQPLDTKPGNTMVGTHINRNITWAELAKPFMTYLARNSFMLQQGIFVADIAYLLNEGAPSTMPIWGTGLDPSPPEGYDYDYINADAIINRMTVGLNGRLVLPDSMSYKMLVLPNTEQMTITVLAKLHELVKNGATIIGRRPMSTPGLSGYPASEMKLKILADDLWGDLDGISRTRRSFGKGQVIWGMPLISVLKLLEVPKDVEYSRPLDADVSWIHRRSGDTDIYFIVNSTDKELKTDIRFRVSGKEAEIWHPESGQTEPASFQLDKDRTVVPLQLSERQSVFVVFRQKTNIESRTISPVFPTQSYSVESPWEITFPSGLGAPEKTSIIKPGTWTTNEDPGIKYFSGTATYTTTINAPAKWFQPDGKIFLDLGKVGDIAEVHVNGIPSDTLWLFPFRSDITKFLKKGNNKLEIRVTNQWTNRLSGDRLAAAGKKVLNSNLMVRGGQLNESGLLGPVNIFFSNIPDNNK